MTAQVAPAQPLNEVQLMLLRLFSRPMPNQDVKAIREMLLAYYETALHNEVERIIEQKGIKRADFDAVLNKKSGQNEFSDLAIFSNAHYLVTNDHDFNVLKTLPFPTLKVVSLEKSLKKILLY